MAVGVATLLRVNSREWLRLWVRGLTAGSQSGAAALGTGLLLLPGCPNTTAPTPASARATSRLEAHDAAKPATVGRPVSPAASRVDAKTLKQRIVMLDAEIDDDVAKVVIAQLLFLESEDPRKPITLTINSPGGSVTASLAIYDTLQSVKPKVATRCIGQAMGTAAMLLAAGAKGQRSAVADARVKLIELVAGRGAQAPDANAQPAQVARLRETVLVSLAQHTGQPRDTLERDMHQALPLSAAEAKAQGFIDFVEPAPAK